MTKPSIGTGLQIYSCRSGCAIPGPLEREFLALMPPGVQAAIRGYRRWQDRQATLFGRLLLLRALRMQDRDSGTRRFRSLEVTGDGKPFLPGGPEFNISHSGERVVLAVIQSGAVGIDIEKIRPVPVKDFSRYLPEVADLPGKDDADRSHALFFDCWTQKEAVLKGQGRGLLAPLELVVIEGGGALFQETPWFIKKCPLRKDTAATSPRSGQRGRLRSSGWTC